MITIQAKAGHIGLVLILIKNENHFALKKRMLAAAGGVMPANMDASLSVDVTEDELYDIMTKISKRAPQGMYSQCAKELRDSMLAQIGAGIAEEGAGTEDYYDEISGQTIQRPKMWARISATLQRILSDDLVAIEQAAISGWQYLTQP